MPSKALKELPTEVQAKLDEYVASKGLRRTRQRDLIVKTAFGSNDHFTADELWENAGNLIKRPRGQPFTAP